MKKVLFATTALVASAGFAAAEITFSGSAEMGIKGGDRYDVPAAVVGGTAVNLGSEDSPRFHQYFDLDISATGETDGGMTFGATFSIETGDDEDPNAANAIDDETVFIGGAFGTLTMGDTDGAFDKVMTEVALVGSIADDETEHAGFNANGGLDGDEDDQVLRYDYTFGGLGLSLSLEQEADGQDNNIRRPGPDGALGTADDVFATIDSDLIYGLGISYAADLGSVAMTFGLGYQSQSDNGDIVGVSALADFGNGFEAVLNFSSFDDDNNVVTNDYDHVGVGVAYTFDAWSFGANYGEYDFGGNRPSEDGFGLAVNYDLGGGAVIQAGYGDGENVESWSLGVAMSF